MTLTEQVFAQAALLAGELDGRQTNLLRLLCGASASSLAARLREGTDARRTARRISSLRPVCWRWRS